MLDHCGRGSQTTVSRRDRDAPGSRTLARHRRCATVTPTPGGDPPQRGTVRSRSQVPRVRRATPPRPGRSHGQSARARAPASPLNGACRALPSRSSALRRGAKRATEWKAVAQKRLARCRSARRIRAAAPQSVSKVGPRVIVQPVRCAMDRGIDTARGLTVTGASPGHRRPALSVRACAVHGGCCTFVCVGPRAGTGCTLSTRPVILL